MSISFIIILMCSNTVTNLSNAANIELHATVVGNELLVSLKNTSSSNVVVDKRLVVAPVFRELALEIEDDTRSYPFGAMVRVDPPREEDYIVLTLGQFVGSTLELEMLVGSYQLSRGCYDFKAVYEYKWDTAESAFRGPVESNVVAVCIDSTQEYRP